MQNTVLVGLSRQVALARELDVVANNIANLDTTGYKADGSLFQQYLNPSAPSDPSGAVNYVVDSGVWHDMSQGPIERTGNSLDVAIDGKDAFLVVRTPNGERYTRNGALQLDQTGQIVTSEGFPVLGDGGPITLQPNDRQIQISRDGSISVREGNSKVDSARGKLRLVTFANLQQLKKDGNGTFNVADGVQAQPATKGAVIQGAVEKSNVRGVVEMSRLIEITRSYTQIASLMQQQSDLGQTAIDKLAEVPN